MTVNRRNRPNTRYYCKFYTYSKTSLSAPVINDYGEQTQEFSLFSKGLFALEKPMKPKEIVDGDRSLNEQTFILVGNWTQDLANVTHGMYCFIPFYKKLYVVNGNATDPWGDRKKLHIYVVDNVAQDVRQKIPGAKL